MRYVMAQKSDEVRKIDLHIFNSFVGDIYCFYVADSNGSVMTFGKTTHD